jgi:hypothetical protein
MFAADGAEGLVLFNSDENAPADTFDSRPQTGSLNPAATPLRTKASK